MIPTVIPATKSPLKRERIEGTDLVFLRELTGGIYFGEKGRRDGGETAFDNCVYTRAEVQRLAKKGFELAKESLLSGKGLKALQTIQELSK